ncbi:uncharacterized protein B0P05DRAFT_362425 [Gilbertella persicaria]|uniref:uncharacterized protein n=1 Tax=Gilbertella persicaria TaxID=101096 RepID=UPI00221E9E39|nr:uncharacterized protein B0P05DRAFT_362425 [Gilbertella persicaria]KAI8047428.1 hypothetical protein B0P05DRAFT_362425 [Gilbertella persicaria]
MALKNRKTLILIAFSCLYICNTHSAPTPMTSNAVMDSFSPPPTAFSLPPPLPPSPSLSDNYRNMVTDSKEDRKAEKKQEEEEEKEKHKQYQSNKNMKYDGDDSRNSHTFGHTDSADDNNSYNHDHKDSSATSPTVNEPSNTVVTTIIVVATETPTTIYSGSTYNPAKQQGQSSETSQGVNDPNSPGNSNTIGSNNNKNDQILKDLSAYHKLVTGLSIVGGIAGIVLVTAGLIYGRKQYRKRKQFDEEKQVQHDDRFIPPPSSPSAPTSFNHQPLTPPAIARLSSMSDDGDMTVIDFNQNSFADPIMLKNHRQPSTSNLSFAPPHLPAHLASRYNTYRQNQTLSMTSQTMPSAPNAKELDGLRYNDPFQDMYRANDIMQQDDIQHLGDPSSSSSPSHHHHLQATQHYHHHKSESFSLSTDLPPPPAYTPSASPSAPPLYALPPTEEQHYSSQGFEDMSLRRHSISNCSITSNRPISLRRGSGSLTRIAP